MIDIKKDNNLNIISLNDNDIKNYLINNGYFIVEYPFEVEGIAWTSKNNDFQQPRTTTLYTLALHPGYSKEELTDINNEYHKVFSKVFKNHCFLI